MEKVANVFVLKNVIFIRLLSCDTVNYISTFVNHQKEFVFEWQIQLFVFFLFFFLETAVQTTV